MNDDGNKFGNWIPLVGLIITILMIFAGLVTTLNKSVATEILAAQIEKRVEIQSEKISEHEAQIRETKAQLTEIQKSQDKMDKKIDRLLERVK